MNREIAQSHSAPIMFSFWHKTTWFTTRLVAFCEKFSFKWIKSRKMEKTIGVLEMEIKSGIRAKIFN